MSTDEAEYDHDYAGSRLSENSTNEVRPRTVLRIIRNRSIDSGQSTSRGSDHNYISILSVNSGGVRNITINATGGTVENDYDVFDDNASTDANNDDALNSGSTISYDTDNRSEDSVSTVTIISTETNSSEQTNSSVGTHFSEQSSDSLSSAYSIAETGSIGAPAAVDDASTSNETQQMSNTNDNDNIEIISSDTTSPPKKRKRPSLEQVEKSGTPLVKAKNQTSDDEDDGLTCPICLDNWEMSGEHRLASLKCGHLFGDSCIRRWLQESSRQSGQRVCPQCKTKAHPREIRYLYAKRLRAIDRSEEHRMRQQLIEVQSNAQGLTLELATLKMSYAQVTQKLKALEDDNDSLNILLRNGGGYPCQKSEGQGPSLSYKLFMERNIEIAREPGCRVLTYAKEHTALIVSQKITQNLFPGYGLRFVDTTTFKPTNFLHTSIKLLRDISLSDNQQLLVAASMEPKVKLFDLRALSVVASLKPTDKPLWSCSFGRRDNEHSIFLGSQHGSIYIYDERSADTFVNEIQAECDLSPVIQIACVPANELFPLGGFLVCKLTSLWFYEQCGTATRSTRIPIEGRFISMDFDTINFKLVVQTRSCVRYPRARYILGKLNKSNGRTVFQVQVTFFASTNSPVMARCSQIAVESNTLVAAYIQDSKLLSLYDANLEHCVQSLPAQDIVYDTCPIYTKDFTYLAALTETKCRLYKLNST